MADKMKIKKTSVAVSNTNTNANTNANAKPEVSPVVKPSAEAVAVLLKEKPVVSPPKEPVAVTPPVTPPVTLKGPAKVERKAGWNPFYLVEPKVGASVVVPVLGRFRSGVVIASHGANKYLIGKIEGLTENVTLHNAELFATMEDAKNAKAWAETLVSTPLLNPARGDKVAVFDTSAESDYPKPTMYPGEVTGDVAEILTPDGTLPVVPVFFAWENTTDPQARVVYLRDIRCVSDPFAKRFADAYVVNLYAEARKIVG